MTPDYFRRVTEAEWRAFAAARPELVSDVSGMCEPPVLTLNDFSDGKVWPASVVALVRGGEHFILRDELRARWVAAGPR